jgi:hypothetical protein
MGSKPKTKADVVKVQPTKEQLEKQLQMEEMKAREACLSEVNVVLEKYGMVIIPEVRIVGNQISSVCHIGKAG